MEGPLELQRVHSRENSFGLVCLCLESESKLLFSPPQLTFLAFDIMRSLFGWNRRVCLKVTHGQVSFLSGTFTQRVYNLSWQMKPYHFHRKKVHFFFTKILIYRSLSLCPCKPWLRWQTVHFLHNNPCGASPSLFGFTFRLYSLLVV